jgi:DNA-directed RNA polymerase sigma subunit (sigma70/sigma32)
VAYSEDEMRTGAYPRSLPDGAEIARLRALPADERPTLEEIGDRYGVSRQAVFKALKRWRQDQEEEGKSS